MTIVTKSITKIIIEKKTYAAVQRVPQPAGGRVERNLEEEGAGENGADEDCVRWSYMNPVSTNGALKIQDSH